MVTQRLDSMSQDYRDAINHIYGLAHNVCLYDKEQHALLATLHDIEMRAYKWGDSGAYTIQCMLSCIYDGLAFGNWPWMKNGANTLNSQD